jgi:hypothetical protein
VKKCRVCSAEKPPEEFYKKANAADGRQDRCKPCSVESARQWKLAHPDATRASGRKYVASESYKKRRAERRAADPEKFREQKRAEYARNRETYLANNHANYARRKADRSELTINLRKLYGITLEDYDRTLKRQLGRCAICDEQSQRLEVDHCHAGGHVRALLCQPCNNGLGCFRDDPERLRSALRYLRKHAA